MALNVKHGIFTAPTTNGSDTVISLPANFDPKAIILWTAYQTAAGNTGADGIFSVGMGTYRGSVVQQRALSWFDDDGVGTSVCGYDYVSDAILKGRSAQATIDFECDLLSMSSSEVTLDWVDAPASAIRVHYFVLGGGDITDALVDDILITADGNAQNETVASGFGQPDLLIFLNGDRSAFAGGSGDAYLGIGAGYDAATGAEAILKTTNAAGSMNMASGMKANRLGQRLAGVAIDGESRLDARANWPADGFRITKPDAYTFQNRVSYLALRGTFKVAIGRSTTITTGSTVTLPGATGSTPRGLLLFHTNVPQQDTLNTTHADLGYFGVGAFDGTSEGHAGVGNDDGNTTSIAYRTHSETKALQMYSEGAAGVLESEADASFSGANAILTFTDLDTVQRAFGWLLIGAAAAPTSLPLPHPAQRRTLLRM
ncbi:MAG: hypothetical protein KatS3mg015_2808 [Fimbriimonadales bacterium]|nr:MAG: hypothetical protein KatS3mg015_2808 [Fimbriimonadales bacterium]